MTAERRRESPVKACKDVRSEWDQDGEFTAAYDKEFPFDDVTANILTARARHGLTRTEWARRMGRTQPFIAHIESGKFEVKLSNLGAVGAALGEGAMPSL